MRPQVISNPSDIPDLTIACFVVDGAHGGQSTDNIRVGVVYLKDDVIISYRHNRRRELSPLLTCRADAKYICRIGY